MNNQIVNKLKILYVNARSMKTKMDEIDIIVADQDINVIVISETWVRREETKYYNFKNFHSIYASREKRGGGLGIFIHKNLEFEILDKMEQELSYLAVRLSTINFVISGIYRPPSFRKESFYNIIDEKLENLSKLKCKSLLLGDINIDISKQNNNDTKRLMDIYSSNCFDLCNKGVSTRVSDNTTSLIDHIITNSSEKIEVSLKDSPISDHKIQIVNLPLKCNIKKTKFKRIEIQKIKVDMLKNELLKMPINTYKDPNLIYEKILEVFENCSYTKTLKIKENSKPWFDETLIELIKLRDKYFQKKKENNGESTAAELYQHYNKLVKRTIREKKQNYYKENLTNGDQKSMWNTINFIMHNQVKESNKDVEFIKKDNKKIVNPNEICEEFNEHFINVGPKLAAKIPMSFKLGIDKLSSNSMYLKPTDEEEIEDIISSLNSKKSPGFDNISVSIVKTVKYEISSIISKLVNLSFISGIIPEKMKIAKVKPIYKSGSKDDMENYRPISLLPIISKIMEKTMNKRLHDYLEATKYLYKHQYGFRKSCDTESAVLDVVTEFQMQLDANKMCGLLSIDLRKAFDTVNHEILLNLLYQLGIRGIVHKWFHNYLSGRKQFVYQGTVSSRANEIICGVPQGSILGPVLFLIYINSIINIKLKGKVYMFADDTTLIYSADSIQQIRNAIESDLSVLSSWLSYNKLSINYSKSAFMYITKRRLSSDLKSDIKFNNEIIKYSTDIKFLGIILDEHLSWSKHIESIRKKISPVIGVLYRIRHQITLKYLKCIYFSLIYSKLQYLISVWGTARLSIIKPIKILQNKVIKCIYKLEHLEPTRNLYKPRQLLDINTIYKFKVLNFIHSVIYNYKHSNLNFEVNSHKHEHITRQTDMLIPIKIKSDMGKRSILYNGIILYNELPARLKKKLSVEKFKKELKKYLFL